MKSVVAFVKSFIAEEEGLAVTEYGLLLALVAVALVVVLKTFGGKISTWFSTTTTTLTTSTP